MSNKKEIYARVGIASKGLVYVLLGCVTSLTALGLGGEKAGSKEALKFLREQPFGQFFLILIAMGLAGYVFWRLYQVFTKAEIEDYSFKNTILRVSYFISALFYALLAYSALKIAFNFNKSTTIQEVVSIVLSKPFGRVLVFIIAIMILGKAVFQVGKVVTGKYKEDLDKSDLKRNIKQKLLYLGVVGYTLRGVVIAFIAYLIFKAAWFANSDTSGGTKEAFSLIHDEFGVVILLLLSLGMATFGFFKLIQASYNNLDI